MFGAAFLSFPIVATQIYMFVAPGLYRHERAAFVRERPIVSARSSTTRLSGMTSAPAVRRPCVSAARCHTVSR